MHITAVMTDNNTAPHMNIPMAIPATAAVHGHTKRTYEYTFHNQTYFHNQQLNLYFGVLHKIMWINILQIVPN